ncbi:hypothetical protein [Streptomyces sp. MAR4 CNX-425]|uniref:hypothetical protein n=1 Tax=Streptomyces sp. MAR4 CNX-425 TaxID=3406343 RepID=UPI003B513E29
MRIRTLARSLAAGALVIGLAGVGAASAQATGHPKHDKCCAKWYNQEISKKINKTWNKTEVEVEVENTFNNRVSSNRYTEVSPSASVHFGPMQSYDREAIVIGR